ncbi:hypothetical protein GCM10011608_49410 [Micromonospora sonchi]|uniref:DUF305 domain-containing protein n=1 Tax=Micromonospora sonchi TaxID=1763543 RepID=A0A917U4T8_9ACTN|nr:DUF305 domain-containing protein [Micromonospora sonchi]GGM58540.1 hypothetical protein GCM10011608_49410 [Micromonospora sonchi]
MRVVVSVPTAVLAAALLLGGCAARGDTPSPAGTPTPATASGTGSAGPFSATDVAWLQLNVAMIERLLPVLDLVPDRSADPAWRGLAARVEEDHRSALARSRRLLSDAGASATNPHAGHDMPGMVTAEELAALRKSTGRSFHLLVARHLRAHLTQTVRVAAAAQQSGAHPVVTALAAAAVQEGIDVLAQLDQLDQLDRLDPDHPPGQRERVARAATRPTHHLVLPAPHRTHI